MKVVFTTNIDHYNNRDVFTTKIQSVPRIGDTVSVKDSMIQFYREKGLPSRLEVTSVTWMEELVICELHYSQHQLEIYKHSSISLF